MKKILFVLTLSVTGSFAWADSFTDISNAARQQGSPASQYVNERLIPDVRKQLAAESSRCSWEADVKKTERFDVALELDEDGAIVDSSVSPETSMASCLRDSIREKHMPKPPKAPFFAVIPQVVAEP